MCPYTAHLFGQFFVLKCMKNMRDGFDAMADTENRPTAARPNRRRGDTRLPDDLAAGLGRDQLDALDSRARRQILRVLSRDGGLRDWSRTELVQTGEVDCSPACILYHSRVLVMCGAATAIETDPNPNGDESISSRYRSTVGADSKLASVLAASEGLDSGPFSTAAPAS
jgi:hypothetical protein